MGLGATYRFDVGGVKYTLGADVVGAPALGPTAFMHRDSARDNPSAPLTHHYIDSTHITYGVLRSGVEIGQIMVEASAFRGEEPDENRLNIEAAENRLVVVARQLAARPLAGAVLRRSSARRPNGSNRPTSRG